jgi:hypothetical protein
VPMLLLSAYTYIHSLRQWLLPCISLRIAPLVLPEELNKRTLGEATEEKKKQDQTPNHSSLEEKLPSIHAFSCLLLKNALFLDIDPSL